MRVLVLNAGSSNLKWAVIAMADGSAAEGSLEQQGSIDWQEAGQADPDKLREIMPQLGSIDAVGHRIVHGGPSFNKATRIDAKVRKKLEALSAIDPLHAKAALACVAAALQILPDPPHVASFDTTFHRTLPEAHARYPLPWEVTQTFELQRYGFHGLSVAYSVERSRTLLNALPARMIVCHLGSGCSVTAVADGRSVDTSMGFTPLEGVMMATRCGSIDPGLLFYLQDQGIGSAELSRTLNKNSGLLGVSGVSADVRKVLEASERGNQRARLAYEMFVHSISRVVGSMLPALGGLDTLVFTGGVGEHQARVRRDVTAAFTFLGLTLDEARNQRTTADDCIHAPESRVRILVITAREDLMIAREVAELLTQS